MTLSKGASNSRSLRLNLICGIVSREFGESRFKNDIVIRNLGSGGGNTVATVERKYLKPDVQGETVTVPMLAPESEELGLVWDEPRLPDDAMRETWRYLEKRKESRL